MSDLIIELLVHLFIRLPIFFFLVFLVFKVITGPLERGYRED